MLSYPDRLRFESSQLVGGLKLVLLTVCLLGALTSCGPAILDDDANLDRAILNKDTTVILKYAKAGHDRALKALRSYSNHPSIYASLKEIRNTTHNDYVRGRVVGLLSYHFSQTPEARSLLLREVRNARAPVVDAILEEIEANAKLSDDQKREIFVAASRHPNSLVRLRAAQNLKRIGAPESSDLFFSLLSSEDENIQESALRSLTGIVDDRFVPRLRQLVQSPNRRVRELALKAASDYEDFEGLLANVSEKLIEADDDLTRELIGMKRTRIERNKWLFSIGVGNYADAPDINYSSNSTRAFSTMARLKLGVPDDQAVVLLNREATGTRIRAELNSLLNRVRPGDMLYFYYSGHGLPSRDGKAAYILPQDGLVGSYEDPEFNLDSIIDRMLKSGAGRVVAFVDSCFSGRSGAKELVFPGVAPMMRAPSREFNRAKVSVFFAGKSDQFSNEYLARGHRMFTYFAVRGIMNGHTQMTELEKYIRQNVSRESRKLGVSFTQEPYLDGAVGLNL